MSRCTTRCTVDARGGWWAALTIDCAHGQYRADECEVPLAMNTEYFESLARLTPALHDTDCAFTARGSLRTVRAEAVRQSRWLQQAWTRTLTTNMPGVPGPIGSPARVRRADANDVRRQMGEDVPSWFD